MKRIPVRVGYVAGARATAGLGSKAHPRPQNHIRTTYVRFPKRRVV